MKIEISDIELDIPIRFKATQFESGQKHLITGPSGAGKTTLLHLILGLFLPKKGFVKIDESNLSHLNDDQRTQFRKENIGVIFQKVNLLTDLTAIENIQLGLSEKIDIKKIKLIFSRLNLEHTLYKQTSVLSLGEQQRIAVARVLYKEPNIILADEPTSSLDQTNADIVMKSLVDISKNKTLLVVSHDQRIALNFDKCHQFADLVKL